MSEQKKYYEIINRSRRSIGIFESNSEYDAVKKCADLYGESIKSFQRVYLQDVREVRMPTKLIEIPENERFVICPVCGKFCWREEEVLHEIGGQNCKHKWNIYWNGDCMMNYELAESLSLKEKENWEKRNTFLEKKTIIAYGDSYTDVVQNFMNEYTKYYNLSYDERTRTKIVVEPSEGGNQRTFEIFGDAEHGFDYREIDPGKKYIIFHSVSLHDGKNFNIYLIDAENPKLAVSDTVMVHCHDAKKLLPETIEELEKHFSERSQILIIKEVDGNTKRSEVINNILEVIK